MPTRPRFFDTTLYYHIYNRGVEKRTIFKTGRDYQRFFDILRFYLHDQKISFATFQRLKEEEKANYFKVNPEMPEKRRVHIICYCLMHNHFHLLLNGVRYNGITSFVSDVSNSHTRYFNIKHERVGRLFQGTFKSKEIVGEESLLQVSRYIHLNPVISETVGRPEDYSHSSYKLWVGQERSSLVSQGLVSIWLEKFGGTENYKKFVESKIDEDPKWGIENLTLE